VIEYLGAGAGAFSLYALVRWLLWLRFCRWLVKTTGRSDSLEDAAKVAKAYRA
jgi:hypothetical protein